MEFTTYLIFFLLIYICYFIFVIARKKAVEKFKTSTYVLYLVNVYKIKVDKINPYILVHMISLVNAFILSTSLYIISNVDGVLGYLLGGISIFGLLFLMYHILGMILKKKGDKDV